jgi:hypothetical protein
MRSLQETPLSAKNSIYTGQIRVRLQAAWFFYSVKERRSATSLHNRNEVLARLLVFVRQLYPVLGAGRS